MDNPPSPSNPVVQDQKNPSEGVQPQTGVTPQQPVQEVSQQPEVPVVQPKPKSKKWPWLVLVGVILILIGIGSYFGYQYFQTKKQVSVPTVPTVPTGTSPTPTADPTAGWKIFSNNEYIFKYPPDWDTFYSSSNGNLFVAPIDRIEEIKELFSRGDGFGGGQFLTMTISELDNATVPVSDEFQNADVSNAMLGGKTVSKYVITVIQSSPLGNPGDRIIQLVLPHGQKYLAIDLLDDDYEEVYDQILSTFEFTNLVSSLGSENLGKLSFKYPEGWERYEVTQGQQIQYKPAGVDYPAFLVYTIENPQNLSLKEFGNDWEIKPGFYSPNAEEVTVSGITGYYQKNQHCEPLTCDEFAINYEGNIYVAVVTYGGVLVGNDIDEEIGTYQKVFEEFLSTFEFTN